MKAATKLLGDVYTQIADLEDESRVFAADIVYHNACMSTYLKKYERLNEESKTPPRRYRKRELFQNEVESI